MVSRNRKGEPRLQIAVILILCCNWSRRLITRHEEPIMKELVGAWFDKLANAGTLPSDTEDERLCKSILTFAATLIVVLAVFWVTVYAVLGFWVSALIPFAY